MSNKYLRDLGLEVSPEEFNTDSKPKFNKKKFKKQREKFGFDEREVYDLDYTSATWLYSHLCMYLDRTRDTVDLTLDKFTVPTLCAIPKEKLKYIDNSSWPEKFYNIKFENLTLLDCIETCVAYLEYYLSNQDTIEIETEMKANEKLKCAFKIYAEIIITIWW